MQIGTYVVYEKSYYRVVVRIIAGVLSVDALEAGEGVVVVSALHHELGALWEREQPETKQEGRNTARRHEPVPRVVREASVFDTNSLDGDDAPRNHCGI